MNDVHSLLVECLRLCLRIERELSQPVVLPEYLEQLRENAEQLHDRLAEILERPENN